MFRIRTEITLKYIYFKSRAEVYINNFSRMEAMMDSGYPWNKRCSKEISMDTPGCAEYSYDNREGGGAGGIEVTIQAFIATARSTPSLVPSQTG